MFTFGAKGVVIIAAVITNINIIAILVDSKRNFVGKEVFVAVVAKQVIVRKTTGANIGTVMDHSHLAFIMVFLAVLTEAVIFVQTAFADVNMLAVAIDNFPCFGAIIFAIMAELATIVIAILTEKFRRNFVGTRNAKTICSNIENFKVMGVVLANGNFCVEVWMNPVTITSKAVTARDMNGMFIPTIFFGLPEVRNALKFGKFTLNQIAIKFRLGLSPTSTAISVIEATLEQKPVEGFIHKQLPCRLAVIERFGIIRIRSRKDDKCNVVASVTGAPTVVFAIHDVEGVTRSHSRAAIISFGI